MRVDTIITHATPLITMEGPAEARGGASASAIPAIDDGDPGRP
jgi:hypothetical protein